MSTPSNNGFPTEASQSVAWDILGPEIAGWVFQIFMSGACFQKAADLYSRQSMISRPMKLLMTTVVVLNTLVFINTIAELLMWSIDQHRDTDSLLAFKIPDQYQPILAGAIAAIVQAFFAERAWKICNKSMIFACIIGFFMITSFGGAVGLGILQILNPTGTTHLDMLLTFTEIWTWTTVVTDLIISVVIIVGLLQKKTDQDMPTDNLVMKIANAALQSASLTTSFALSAAIVYAIQWHSPAAVIELGFIYALPSLYTYSLLWCLNCTNNVRQEQVTRAHRSGFDFSMTPFESIAINSYPDGVYSRALAWNESTKMDALKVGTEGTSVLEIETEGGSFSDGGREIESLADFLRK